MKYSNFFDTFERRYIYLINNVDADVVINHALRGGWVGQLLAQMVCFVHICSLNVHF